MTICKCCVYSLLAAHDWPQKSINALLYSPSRGRGYSLWVHHYKEHLLYMVIWSFVDIKILIIAALMHRHAILIFSSLSYTVHFPKMLNCSFKYTELVHYIRRKGLLKSIRQSSASPTNVLAALWLLTHCRHPNQGNEPLTQAMLVPCSTHWPSQGRGTTKRDHAKSVWVSWKYGGGDCRGLWNKEQVDWWLISCGCLADWDSLAAVTLMNYTAEKNTLHSDYCQQDMCMCVGVCVCVCVCVLGLMACV